MPELITMMSLPVVLECAPGFAVGLDTWLCIALCPLIHVACLNFKADIMQSCGVLGVMHLHLRGLCRCSCSSTGRHVVKGRSQLKHLDAQACSGWHAAHDLADVFPLELGALVTGWQGEAQLV